MRLLNLVEEDDTIGLAPHLLGELAAFLVTHVARRRADEPRDGVLLHVFAHVELDERLGVAEHLLGQGLGEERFAHARRTQERKCADGALRILQVCAGAAQRLGHGQHGVGLADDHLGEHVLDLEQARGLVLLHPFERDARPLGHDVEDFILVHLDPLLFLGLAPGFERGLELFLRLLFLIAEGGGAFEVLILDRAFLAILELFDGGLEILQVRRAGHGSDAGTGTGLIHHVNGLVRQEPAGDIAVGELHGGLDGGVRDLGAVMLLILGAQPLENRDGILDGRRLHLYGLEAAFQGPVLLDVFAVFVQRGCTDALHLAAGQGGFDDVAGIHRAFGAAGPDDGVHLVDEEDDVLVLSDLVHHGLDAFLELAAILGARDHQRQVQHDDPLVAENLRDVAFHNLLSEAFDDGRLAHARLAEQHGVVLRAAAENLDHALNLGLAPDHRVHVAFAGDLGEVAAEGFQGGRLALALLFAFLLFAFAATGGFLALILEVGIELLEDLLPDQLDVDVQALEDLRGDAITLTQQAEEDVLGADVGVVERLGLLGGKGEHLFHPGRVRNVAHLLLVRAGADLFLHLHAHGFQIEAHLLEDVHGDALAELD